MINMKYIFLRDTLLLKATVECVCKVVEEHTAVKIIHKVYTFLSELLLPWNQPGINRQSTLVTDDNSRGRGGGEGGGGGGREDQKFLSQNFYLFPSSLPLCF